MGVEVVVVGLLLVVWSAMAWREEGRPRMVVDYLNQHAGRSTLCTYLHTVLNFVCLLMRRYGTVNGTKVDAGERYR